MPTPSTPPADHGPNPSDPVLVGFIDIKNNDNAKFKKVLTLVKEIQKLSPPPSDGAPKPTDKKEKNYERAVGMLDTDVTYIMDNLTELEKTPFKKRADVLLQFLIEATEKRTADDFAPGEVNRKKLLQIIAKLKLWVPPVVPEEKGRAAQEAEKKKKKEEAPFVSRKEKDKAATEVVKELFGLRCDQWGMDGLLKSYGELRISEKLCLLCFSGFRCEVEKDEEGNMKSKELEIKKRILTHWWVGEGLIDLHLEQLKATPDLVGEAPAIDPPDPVIEGTPEVVGEAPAIEGEGRNSLDPVIEAPAIEGEGRNLADDVNQRKATTVEEVGESILKVLEQKGFIEPVMKRARESSRVKMHPFVHSFVTALAKRAGFFDISGKDGMMRPSFGLSQRACLVKSADKQSSCNLWETFTDDRDKLKRFAAVQTLFNVNEPIIDIKTEWFSRMTNLVVLHLGTWKSEPEAVEHIEVEDDKFLDDLKLMGKLKLFSLQGVSTIMKLTDSVCKLENLVILDLRECHNLEELPAEIGSLRSLTHLDITNCHLLTNLPKGISLLSNVEVLKGFVIYDQKTDQKRRKNCALNRCWRKTKECVIHDIFRLNNKKVCTLKDLGNLKKLRQLSLVVNTDKFPSTEDVEVFMSMVKLTKLKISWEKSFKEENEENSSKGKNETENSPKNEGDNTALQVTPNQGDNNASSQETSGQGDNKASEENPNQGDIEPSQEISNQGNNNAAQETSNQGDNKASEEKPNQGDNKALEEKPNQGGNKVSKDSSGSGWCFSAGQKTNNAAADGQQESIDSNELEKKSNLLPHIIKLELWCYPKKKAPYWLLPKQLRKLEKLYIKGGELDEVPGEDDTDKWLEVNTLRLKYLPNLQVSWLELNGMFPAMSYLEKWVCDGLKYFPCDQEGVWKK